MSRPEVRPRAARRPLRWLPALAVAGLLAGCIAAPYTYPYGSALVVTSTFDRAWDAALGAARDAGIDVSQSEPANGLIRGTRAGAVATITVVAVPDGKVQVTFNAPSAVDIDPTLNEIWLANYQRRMGR